MVALPMKVAPLKILISPGSNGKGELLVSSAVSQTEDVSLGTATYWVVTGRLTTEMTVLCLLPSAAMFTVLGILKETEVVVLSIAAVWKVASASCGGPLTASSASYHFGGTFHHAHSGGADAECNAMVDLGRGKDIRQGGVPAAPLPLRDGRLKG